MEDQPNREAVLRLLLASHPGATFDDDEQMFKAIIEDYTEYVKLIEADAQQQQIQTERSRIRQESLEALRQEATADSEELDQLISLIDSIVEKVQQGRYEPQDIKLIRQALNYDTDVAQAEIKGRNATIQETMATPDPTDGLPHLNGLDAYINAYPNSLFAIAKNA